MNWIPPNREQEPRKPKRIELHLSASRTFVVLTAIVSALIMAAALVYFSDTKKMRGLENLRFPDPSSPTVQPSANDNPIPPLKAPTRPKRD